MMRKILGPGLSLILFAAAVWLLHSELRAYHLRDILHAFDAITGAQLWAAVGLAILSYAVMTGYDVLAMRYIQYPLSYSKLAWHPFQDTKQKSLLTHILMLMQINPLKNLFNQIRVIKMPFADKSN